MPPASKKRKTSSSAHSCASSLVVIVSGQQFVLDEKIQSIRGEKYPESTLGILLRNRDRMNVVEPFEGRIPSVFGAMVRFLEDGKWVIPKGMSVSLFREEMAFWMFPCPDGPTEYEFEDWYSSLVSGSQVGQFILVESENRCAITNEQSETIGELRNAFDHGLASLRDTIFVKLVTRREWLRGLQSVAVTGWGWPTGMGYKSHGNEKITEKHMKVG